MKCTDESAGPVPASFSIRDRDVRVLELLDRWPGGECGYYKVRGDDGSTYILRQEARNQTWSLTFFVADDAHWPAAPHAFRAPRRRPPRRQCQ
ncbi:MAG: hypothetical protein IPK13_24950 [Deltaproteobacteria bacterium]|nr:hypothetical protein [Deltaproteobacteria bacterium]